ncbi:MAG: serine racemase VanT catalytic subunit [Clostridia bacterium]
MDRAWIELDLNNLENNINEIKKIIPEKTKIMAVVKANAYGHGDIQIARKLSDIGIEDFAVATIQEGIKLRKSGIKGSILILGYTDISSVDNLLAYDLTQTSLDLEYAKQLNKYNVCGKKVKVHIKLNTGMNRIGESYKNIDNVVKTYRLENIKVEGIFSHLCVADSLEKSDVEFTNAQIDNFTSCVNEVKKHVKDIGKVHLQNSYGLLNYPAFIGDYVRPGIIMYGVYSTKDKDIQRKINIKPVLSLKAKITSTRTILKGESAGYGRKYIASKDTKIASVCIGYADGYPRALSCKDTKVLVNGEYATVIGNICMDQLILDISDCKNVKRGDVVTLIGRDKDKEITAMYLAEKADSMTYEILSRLGDRLNVKI